MLHFFSFKWNCYANFTEGVHFGKFEVKCEYDKMRKLIDGSCAVITYSFLLFYLFTFKFELYYSLDIILNIHAAPVMLEWKLKYCLSLL